MCARGSALAILLPEVVAHRAKHYISGIVAESTALCLFYREREPSTPAFRQSACSSSFWDWSGPSRSRRRSFQYHRRRHRAPLPRSRPRLCCADLRRALPNPIRFVRPATPFLLTTVACRLPLAKTPVARWVTATGPDYGWGWGWGYAYGGFPFFRRSHGFAKFRGFRHFGHFAGVHRFAGFHGFGAGAGHIGGFGRR